jgi:hypothetical protein
MVGEELERAREESTWIGRRAGCAADEARDMELFFVFVFSV